MGQIKNIKLHIVTDIKTHNEEERFVIKEYNITMQLTQQLLRMKKGWVPRSLKIPGNVYRGKKQKPQPITYSMRKTKREREAQIAQVDKMLEFPYLQAHETEVEEEVQRVKAETEDRLAWQRRILGPDVYGLGAGKPSFMDHLMRTDVRRYAPVINGPLSKSLLKENPALKNGENFKMEELDSK